jgi:hypothetical protein
VRFSCLERLSGGLEPEGEPLGAQPLSLELRLEGRSVLEVALGAPMAVRGTFTAEGGEGPLPPHGEVEGSSRILAAHGVFYDLRLGAPGAPSADRVVLRGTRRFVRGDLWLSATTLVADLEGRGRILGRARLRFNARDDVLPFLRSIRLGARA